MITENMTVLKNDLHEVACESELNSIQHTYDMTISRPAA